MILFQNNANDCYLNSVLQVLLNNKRLQDYFETLKIENDINTLFYNLFNALENTPLINPSFIKRVLSTSDNESRELFSNCMQQDSHEALMKILDILHETNKVSGKSFIDKYFTGKYKTFINCTNCDYSSITKNNFRDIDFYPQYYDIEECIMRSFDKEDINGACEKCSENTLTKQTMIHKYPQVLIVSIKRYSNELSGNIKKLNDEFTLDIKLYLGETTYVLTSVIHHHGRSPNSGHYTTDAYRNGKWYKINDDVAHEIDPNNIDSMSAYILIYCKI